MRTKDDFKSHLKIIKRARHTGKCLATQGTRAYKEGNNPIDNCKAISAITGPLATPWNARKTLETDDAKAPCSTP